MESKTQEVIEILSRNKVITDLLEKIPRLGMKNWYLGSGCIAQTVWNSKSGFDLNNGILDYDLVYFDDSDISYEAEDAYIQKGKKFFGDTPIEIRNQARVHVWYKDHFGKEVDPYKSVEEAIRTWPTTATAVGARINDRGGMQIFAPFGLDDLLNLIVRANKARVTEEIYMKKVARWTKIWPKLRIIPW